MAKESNRAINAIIEEATEWLVRLSEPGRASDSDQEFAEWLKSSPLHVREYLRAEAIWHALAELDFDKRIDVSALLQKTQENVVQLGIRSSKRSPESLPGSRTWMTSIAGLASAVVIVAATFWLVQSASPDQFSTGIGEQRRIVLEDGSVVELNTRSLVEVDFAENARRVTLISGEALFTVEKALDRPFIVTSGVAEVRALGTRFNVYSQSDVTVVTVLEGRVALQKLIGSDPSPHPMNKRPPEGEPALELAAGDQASVELEGTLQQEKPNTEKVVAWRQRRLIFENDSLADVVAEFNRYNTRQLTIEDEGLRTQTISGVFDADRPDALVQFLTRYGNFETIDHLDGNLEIRRSR